METPPTLASLPPDIIRRIVGMVKGSLVDLRLICPAWNAVIMASGPSLASLDPAIIRRIIRMADDSLNELRMISPSWNSLVAEYLATTRLGALERVYLYSGVPGDNEEDEADRLMLRPRTPYAQMVAILPDRHKKNVGVGRWLSVFRTHTGEAIEVTSSPQRHELFGSAAAEKIEENKAEPKEGDAEATLPGMADSTKSGSDEAAVHDVLLCGVIASLTILSILSLNVIGINFLGLVTLLGIGYSFWKGESEGEVDEEKAELPKDQNSKEEEMKKTRAALMMDPRIKSLQKSGEAPEQKHLPQVARLIAMFSSIETLVLEESYNNFMDVVQNTLGAAKIDRLEIRAHELGHEQHTRIVDWCRKYGIRHVFIKAYQYKMNNIREFAKKLTDLGVAIDLYHILSAAHQVYFNKSKLFWDKTVAELSAEQVSLRISTFHDPAFANGGYNHNMRVKAHIRIEKSDTPITQPLTAVAVKRGFIMRSY